MGKVINFKDLSSGEKMDKNVIEKLRGNFSVLEHMPDAAELVLSDCNFNGGSVPIVKIVNSLGFKVFRQAFKEKELSGYIAIDAELQERFGGDKVISVNRDDNFGHQRFTIAHELAHYIFDFDEAKHITYYNKYKTNDSDSDSEKRANFFAANVLMPTNYFNEQFNKHKIPESLFETTKKLAEIFEVSPEAVKRRIDECKLELK